ncbi:flagellin, partial [Pseudoalteromonas sp. Z1A6]
SVAAEKIGSNQVNLQSAAADGFGQAAAATATLANSAVAGGTYDISGRNDAQVTIAAGASAEDAAAAINSVTSSTGVTAQARTEAGLSLSALATADESVSFELNGEKLSFVGTGTKAGDEQALAEAINSATDEHGVTATIENGALSVSNNNGADITFAGLTDSAGTPSVELDVTPEGYNGAAGAAVTLNTAAGATRVSGAVQLNSSETFSAKASDASLAAGVTDVTSKLNDVADVDITSQKGSQDALAIIDNAIANIDSQRASLGAVQNRFDHTISNLANISENVSASRSRIQDTDFATETAEMTKNQILQQAGTSILSQANQLPQTALSLLG